MRAPALLWWRFSKSKNGKAKEYAKAGRHKLCLPALLSAYAASSPKRLLGQLEIQ